MATDDTIPRRLRDLIAADLRPVRPLLGPWQRVLAVAPLGVLVFLGVPLILFAVRRDAATLGPWLAWGLSALQVAVGGLVAAAAFREVVPGCAAGLRSSALRLALAVGLTLAVTFVTWSVSPSLSPPGAWGPFTVGCFRLSFRDGLPVLAILLALAARGLVARPALVGGLCGTSAGLASDAGWRMVCGLTEPSHVVLGHVGAVMALALTGAAAMSVWTRLLRWRRRTWMSP